MKNNVVEIDENIVAIEIHYKDHTLLCYINREDLDKVSSVRGTWHITRNRSGHIDGVRTKIQINKVRKQIWLHNFIFDKVNPSNVVDHIDHNTLNNTRSNLREVSIQENSQNMSTILLRSTTGCRNITIEGGRYRVRIGQKSFGCFDSLEEAKEVASRERAKIFPITSELNNKIIL